ncbi:MAG TPA: hypothetical protein VK942_14210, partial [Actinomycetes bacterium]|nr:hypothetical protein [Actinomycetes bacterium]
MPLSLDSMLVQPSSSGSFNAASGAATLPATTAGSTTLIVIATGGSTGVSSVVGHANDFPGAAATARVYVFRRSEG